MTEFAEIDLPRSLFACIAGGLLAWLHLRALSWSLHRFEAGAHGEASLLMSGVGRVALVSAGFLALCGHEPVLLVPSLLGFLVTRTIVVRHFSLDRLAPSLGRRKS